jgi:lipoprotein-anchoring transpeptidase ErfK/SrfK
MHAQLDTAPSHLRLAAAGVLALTAILLLGTAPTAYGSSSAIVWKPPTHGDGFRYTVAAGEPLSFTLTAATSLPSAAVRITPVHGLPLGARVSSSAGSVARATFRWQPTEAGDYQVQFAAAAGHGASAPLLRYTIHVKARAYSLANARVAHWATVLKPIVARTRPSGSAPAVTQLATTTTDGTQNIVLILEGVDYSRADTWYRVRLPILPNNSTGWVPAWALGRLYAVHTHLYVDREKLRLTLKRDGKTIFTSIVGTGRPYWPTPRGQFYVRDKLTNFDNPFYGPVAFGTSARSAVLTDWPGGGFVGIHGTNEPELLPGHVSHGCIRMPNANILRLAALLQVGTPLTIT